MKARILCLMLVAVASPAWGQQQTESSRSSDPKADEKPSITGRVLRADTDQPLNKVKLTLQSVNDSRSYAGETQDDGTFQINNFEPGMYWLSAERTGYIRQELGARRPGESRTGTVLDLKARGAQQSAIVIKLVRGGIVGGKVIDQDGDPIAHASVQLMRYRYFRGRRALIPLTNPWGAMTNELGEYKIGDIPPGDYYISAVVRQFARPTSSDTPSRSNSISSTTPSPGSSSSSVSSSPSNSTSNGSTPPSNSSSTATPQKWFAPAFYPSAAHPQESSPVSITSGSELSRFDITLSQSRTFRVKGKVTSPLEGDNIMVTLTTDGELPIGLFNTQYFPVRPGGVFDFSGVFPGDYVLVAQGAQDGQPRSARQLVHVIDSNVDDVLLVASGSVAVTGKLTLETEQPQSSDAPPKMPGGIRVILTSADNPFIPEVSETVSDDGAFSFKNLGLNRYEVRVTGLPPNYWLKSIKTTRAEITDRVMDLTSGVTSAKLLLSAMPDAGTVSGRALNADGDPINGATVVLVPSGDAPAPSLFQVTRSAKGAFNFFNVPPGDYYILAWEDIEPGAYLDPEFRKRFSSSKAEVTGKKAARVSVDVTVVAQR